MKIWMCALNQHVHGHNRKSSGVSAALNQHVHSLLRYVYAFSFRLALYSCCYSAMAFVGPVRWPQGYRPVGVYCDVCDTNLLTWRCYSCGGCIAVGAFLCTAMFQGWRLQGMMLALRMRTRLLRVCIVSGSGVLRGWDLWWLVTLLLRQMIGLAAVSFADEVLIDWESHSKNIFLQVVYHCNCISICCA